ncbi:MAG: hypothetical protein Fur0020_12080 [Thermodesulfovibrionia bacterium]
MKIAINLRLLNPGKIGGMEVYIRNLLEHMLELSDDIEYLLFVTKENTDTFYLAPERVQKVLIDHENYNQIILQTLRERKFDLYFSPLLILEPLLVEIPTVIKIPDMQHEYYPEFFSPDVFKWRRENYLRSARVVDAILTVSEFSKEGIVKYLNINREKVHVTYLSAPEYFETVHIENDKSIKKKYHLPERFGLYPANTWPHKNHRALILALDIYRNKYGEPPHIVLTGSESEGHGDIIRLIKKYDMEHYIHHIGYVEKEELPRIYRMASFMVFPSLFEGFGIPILEAMKCDCPVICSNCTSLPEVAGDAAIYFNPLNPDEIAERIHYVMNNPDVRETLIKRGRNQSARFSWRSTAIETLSLFKRVASLTVGERRNRYPLVSIITPSFNHGRFIEETIKSVLSQDYPNIEYIVVDGGSNDNTIEVLEKYSDRIRYISEPDEGQADAINKGIQMTSGELIAWLNSDDTYNPGTITRVVERFLFYPELVMLYGDAHYIDENGNTIGVYPSKPFDLHQLAHECFICQPTTFLRRDALNKIGLLDTGLHTCMDYDLWIRIGRRFSNDYIHYLKGEFLANSRMYPQNKTLGMREKVYEEVIKTVKRHFGFVSESWIYGYIYEIVEGNNPLFFGESQKLQRFVFRFHKFYSLMQFFGIRWGLRYLRQWLRKTYSLLVR